MVVHVYHKRNAVVVAPPIVTLASLTGTLLHNPRYIECTLSLSTQEGAHNSDTSYRALNNTRRVSPKRVHWRENISGGLLFFSLKLQVALRIHLYRCARESLSRKIRNTTAIAAESVMRIPCCC